MPRRRGLRPRLLAAVIRSNATLAFAAERQIVGRLRVTPFQQQWIEIGRRFQLTVRTSVTVPLGGETLVAPVLLEHFGAKHGMVLVTKYSDVKTFTDQLGAAGFGYSCLPEAGPEGIDEAYVIDMLRDWGWSGSGTPPTWYAA